MRKEREDVEKLRRRYVSKGQDGKDGIHKGRRKRVRK